MELFARQERLIIGTFMLPGTAIAAAATAVDELPEGCRKPVSHAEQHARFGAVNFEPDGNPQGHKTEIHRFPIKKGQG